MGNQEILQGPHVGAKSRRVLGASRILSPIDYIHPFHPYLCDKCDFWKNLPDEDGYVETIDDYEAELRAAQEFVPLMKSKQYYSDVNQSHPSKSIEALAKFVCRKIKFIQSSPM
jgi:hypothetical protein